MAKFEIIGNTKLSGKVKIAGNKNAVLPIMAACLLTKDISVLENVPEISDVRVMADLLEIAGAKVQRRGPTLKIDAKNLQFSQFPTNLTTKLRASVLLLAPMLSRLGKIGRAH